MTALAYCRTCDAYVAWPCATCVAHARMLALVRAATPPPRRADDDRSPREAGVFRHSGDAS